MKTRQMMMPPDMGLPLACSRGPHKGRCIVIEVLSMSTSIYRPPILLVTTAESVTTSSWRPLYLPLCHLDSGP